MSSIHERVALLLTVLANMVNRIYCITASVTLKLPHFQYMEKRIRENISHNLNDIQATFKHFL